MKKFESRSSISESSISKICWYLILQMAFCNKKLFLTQGSTNLIFVCTDFRAHKMGLGALSCTQNYVCIKR